MDPLQVPDNLRSISSETTLRTAALRLARQERADLVRQLIASLDEDADTGDQEVETAWLAEVEQRMNSASCGEASFESWDVAEQQIAARLR